MIGLHVDSVRKQFGNRQVLNDVFISCIPGEVIGLLGRNGAGKSTLLKIIFGAVKADNKFVRVDGDKTNSIYSNRNLIQYLSNDGFLPGNIKIKAIISCFCSPVLSNAVMEHAHVKPFLKQRPGELSGGERRIIEILIMLNSSGRYLLFDEPFNGLSPLYIEVVKEMFRMHGKEKGIIVTDHDYRQVLEIASKIILLDNGNTKQVKTKGELIELGYVPESTIFDDRNPFRNIYQHL